MDTTQQPEGESLDPSIFIEVQQEHINSLTRENLMLGTLVRQQKGEIKALQDLLAQKDERVPEEG